MAGASKAAVTGRQSARPGPAGRSEQQGHFNTIFLITYLLYKQTLMALNAGNFATLPSEILIPLKYLLTSQFGGHYSVPIPTVRRVRRA